MSVSTPNMGLIQSTVNVDNGLVWETNLNSSLTILDGHNHSAGSGVQITPTGLNINSALSFNVNPATNLQSCVFTAQLSLATLRAIYCIGADLYYNDSSGNVIRMTSGGTVNATSSGISSGPASASFVSSVLVVNAAANTPANIQGGSILLGNNVASSKFLELSPPNAMGANYTLTLPALPAQTNVMTLDSSGNMSSITYDAVGQDMTSVGANAVANTRTRAVSTTVGLGGVAKSATNNSQITSSTSPVDVINLSVTITTSGRPVVLGIISDGTTGNGSCFRSEALTSTDLLLGTFYLLNGSTVIAQWQLFNWFPSASATNTINVPAGLYHMDFPAAGTYAYKVQMQSSNAVNQIVGVQAVKLIAYES